MNAVKIISIGQIKQYKTQYGDKDHISLTIRDISMTDPKHNIVAGMFVPQEGIWFRVGDTVLAEIVKNDKYINIKKIERFGDTGLPQLQKEPEVPVIHLKTPDPAYSEAFVKGEVDWDRKDRRVYAQNALRHADEWVHHIFEMGAKEKEVEYFRFAEKVYQWILNK